MKKDNTREIPESLNSYDDFLHWLKNSFFIKIKSLTTKKSPVLITGFIMDKNGVIARKGKVPPEIANDKDWKAFIQFLAPAHIFVMGIKYIK